jgi:anti-sigma factor RsiW
MVISGTTRGGCDFVGDRDETLIAYLYGDVDPMARAAFDAHLPACAPCRNELAALGAVRQQLSAWSPPSFVAEGRSVPASNPQPPGAAKWWQHVPAWAQVAAALVCVGVGAGLANLDVRYDRSGLSVRTGWSRPAAPAGGARDVSLPAAPWRADMAMLEQQLRTELRPSAAAAANPASVANGDNPASPEVLRRVKALVDESEKREQREIALRVAEVLRDVNAQRQADLVKIDRTLGVLQNNTGVEVRRTRQEMLNYLVAASQQKPQ